MSALKISDIEDYWIEHSTEKFSSKVNKTIIENKLYIEKVSLSKIKPTPEYMIEMLSKHDPFSLKYHKKIYDRNEDKLDYKYKSFNEYIFSQYWQLGSSKTVDKKSKEEDGEYYFREEYVNDKWKLISCDIYREDWNIYKYCKDKNINDLKFEWWWFNIH